MGQIILFELANILLALTIQISCKQNSIYSTLLVQVRCRFSRKMFKTFFTLATFNYPILGLMHKTAQNKYFYTLILSQYMVESDWFISHPNASNMVRHFN